MKAAWKAGKRRPGKISKMGRRERKREEQKEKRKTVFNFSRLEGNYDQS